MIRVAMTDADMTSLTFDESVLLTVVDDAGGALLPLGEVARRTAWPGARTFGLRRTKLALGRLVERGAVEVASLDTGSVGDAAPAAWRSSLHGSDQRTTRARSTPP